ncbi:plasmid replication protein RepC [Kiloniella laminariae]|uniref:plasmid replication protein RepC n=1 Tax=Kiloniella laminariae TaxID=454162 RepID=UPI00036BA2BD|nr:plasmid replication protein RepC [Kiloniella laminariae]
MDIAINRGQRDFTPQIAALEKCSVNFSGLPQGVSQYDLLGLLEFIGHDFGFKQTHIRYLAQAIKFTQDKDWTAEAYHPPVVWQSVTSIAIELDRDERTIRRIENDLHTLGAITWRDSGNHKRYGSRDNRGYIKCAFGVDLSPLAELYSELYTHAETVRENRRLWKEEKQLLSSLKRSVRAKFNFAGLDTDELDELSPPSSSTSLDEIRNQYAQLKLLEIAADQYFNDNVSIEQNVDMSASPDKNDRHLYTTIRPNSSKEDTCNKVDKHKRGDVPSRPGGILSANADTAFCFQKKHGVGFTESQDKDTPEIPTSTGIEHLHLKQLLNAATGEFLEHIPLHDRPLAPADIVDAAQIMCHELGINRHAWTEAVSEMGRLSAAVCVLIADKNQYHPEFPIRNPGGFLRGMINKAKSGELKLHRSIFGILEREKFDS